MLSFRAAGALFSAVKAGVFDGVGRGARTAEDVARAASLDPRATRILLDALVALELLDKKKGLYRNTPVVLECLLKDSPRSLRRNMLYQHMVWKSWHSLPEALAAGRPQSGLEDLLADPAFTREYILAMKEISGGPAAEVAKHLKSPGLTAMLDVGAGHGGYSLALMQKCPRLSATLLDMPQSLDVARDLMAGDALSERVKLLPGNYLQQDFGADAYDVVLMSHVTHDEGPEDNAEMLRKAFRALRPGGKAAIHDFTVSEDGSSPLFSAIFSVHMLTYTIKGKVYTVGEYKEMLAAAGFRRIASKPIRAGAANASTLVVGVKP